MYVVFNIANDILCFYIIFSQVSFYLFPKISKLFGKHYTDENGQEQTISDSNDFAMYLLQEAHVAAVAGSAFFAPDCIRFSYASSEETLIEAFKRIRNAVEKLH